MSRAANTAPIPGARPRAGSISVILCLCSLLLWVGAAFPAAPGPPPPAAAAAMHALDEIYRVDMEMRGMWPFYSPRRGNFADAQEWAAERAGAEAAAWRERCRRKGAQGQVAVLAHSGGTLAADRMLAAGMAVDALALWSPGMRPEQLAGDLRRVGLDGAHALVVAGPLDMPRYQWIWHSQAYLSSPLAGKAYRTLEVQDRQHQHATMLILGDRAGRVRGTLPGLDRRRDRKAAPNDLARRFLLGALDARRPVLLLVVGGTDTAYEPGSAAEMMEKIARRVVHDRSGAWRPVTIPANQQQEQDAGKWRPDGRIRLPAGATKPAPRRPGAPMKAIPATYRSGSSSPWVINVT